MGDIRTTETEKKLIVAYRKTDKTGKACVLRMLGLQRESDVMYYGEKITSFSRKNQEVTHGGVL